MHLLDTSDLTLKEFSDAQAVPPYAILSHRWTSDEVTFSDVNVRKFRHRRGYEKFRKTMRQARIDGLRYAWIDSCCINRESSADLSEAINSMFQWYRRAERCYVYLHDVERKTWKETLAQSVWFTRGWTLQELLAPPTVSFFDRYWHLLGDKTSLVVDLSRITGIDKAALETGDLQSYSIAQKMSWAAKRTTTRTEDRAYCLMGLFNVNMPPLYGEGEKAFLRLQQEIIKDSDDYSIFAWSMGDTKFSGLLAPHPACFASSSQITSSEFSEGHHPFMMTNRGLSISFELTPWSVDTYLAYLGCSRQDDPAKWTGVGIFLRRLSEHDQYARINLCRQGLWYDTRVHSTIRNAPRRVKQLFVRKTIDEHREEQGLKRRSDGIRLPAGFSSASNNTHNSKAQFVGFQPGRPDGVPVLNVSSQHRGLRQIALGFDFDFNPVCLLEDTSETLEDSCRDMKQYFGRLSPLSDDEGWELINNLPAVYRKQIAKGICAVKGGRLTNLEIILGDSFTDRGSLLSLYRDTSKPQLVWEFDLDSLTGPFRNHQHRVLMDENTDRGGFQTTCNMGRSERDLEDDDDFLRAFYGVVEKFST